MPRCEVQRGFFMARDNKCLKKGDSGQFFDNAVGQLQYLLP